MDESTEAVAFLAARLDEAQARADELHNRLDCDLWHGGYECTCGHPARVLRDVKADRKLLAAYEAEAGTAGGDWTEGEAGYASGLEAGLLLAIKIRAERFSDHPDWKP